MLTAHCNAYFPKCCEHVGSGLVIWLKAESVGKVPTLQQMFFIGVVVLLVVAVVVVVVVEVVVV